MNPLARLFAYNRWANHQYLDAIEKMPAGQFTQELGGSFSSIQETFVHLAWAEWVWSRRWQGTSPRDRATADQYPTVESVRSYLNDIEQLHLRLFEKGEAPDGAARIRYTNLKGEELEYTFEEMAHHVLMHSAYHRGQIATFMRQLQSTPPSTDYLVYVDTLKTTT